MTIGRGCFLGKIGDRLGDNSTKRRIYILGIMGRIRGIPSILTCDRLVTMEEIALRPALRACACAYTHVRIHMYVYAGIIKEAPIPVSLDRGGAGRINLIVVPLIITEDPYFNSCAVSFTCPSNLLSLPYSHSHQDYFYSLVLHSFYKNFFCQSKESSI